MITLHYHPGNASLAPHIVLRELNTPFTLALVDRAGGGHRTPAYLALNPNGQIPVLQDGDLVLYETVAILLHLADSHPAAGLMPPLGSAERARCLLWLVWMTNTWQPAMKAYFYPERWVDAGNAEGARQVRHHAQASAAALARQLDDHLAQGDGPWLMGAHYTVADAMALLLCRWTRGFEGSAGAPARTLPHIGPYLQRVLARPAVQQALAAEGLAAPWV